MFFFGAAYTYTAWVYFLFQQLTELFFNSQQKIYISQSAQKEIDMYPLFSLYVWNVWLAKTFAMFLALLELGTVKQFKT